MEIIIQGLLRPLFIHGFYAFPRQIKGKTFPGLPVRTGNDVGRPVRVFRPALLAGKPAEMVGIADACGSLAAGRRADIVMITDREHPAIDSVYVLGEKL